MMKVFLFLIFFLSEFMGYSQDAPQGLEIKTPAPMFTATDQYGKGVSLKELLKKGSVVLIFYRGQWCPYCNKQLTAMEDSLTLITSRGATVVAVTPEKPENILKTIEKTKASYAVLFDEGLKIMNDYKVAFQLEASVIEKYKGYGIDFSVANGSNGANLPVPAVYIIDKKGIITYRYFDANYRKRPSVKEIASQL